MHPPNKRNARDGGDHASAPKVEEFISNSDNIVPVQEFQAASLRRRFALAHYLAVTIAGLAFAVSR